jgi:lipopolysaccharide export LptBFGC system permease protein LptF
MKMSHFFGWRSEDRARGFSYLRMSLAFFAVSALLLFTRPAEVPYLPVAVALISAGIVVLCVSIWHFRKGMVHRKPHP